MNDKITLEQVQNFVDMLTGKPVDEMNLTHQPQLSRREAFSVVYYLQEEMGIIPDHYEMCSECEYIFDSQCAGGTRKSDDAWLCDECATLYDYCERCCQLVPYGSTDDGECPECRALSRKEVHQ